MGYVIHYSRVRRWIALGVAAAGAAVLAQMLYAYLLTAISDGFNVPIALMVIVIAASGIMFGCCRWCYEGDRQVCGIRLMGGPCVLLYFPPLPARPVRASRAELSATTPSAGASVFGPPPAAVFPYDGYPAMAVTVTRVVHWPGRLIGLTFDATRPTDAALDRLAGPRKAPRVQSWLWWRRGRVPTSQMPTPRHLLIFADAMSAHHFRALVISLACLQRGVTFVEHR